MHERTLLTHCFVGLAPDWVPSKHARDHPTLLYTPWGLSYRGPAPPRVACTALVVCVSFPLTRTTLAPSGANHMSAPTATQPRHTGALAHHKTPSRRALALHRGHKPSNEAHREEARAVHNEPQQGPNRYPTMGW